MKKYKCIKSYIGCPVEVGQIIENNYLTISCQSGSRVFCMKLDISEYPEFREEVVEKKFYKMPRMDQRKYFFDNGYGISIISGFLGFCDANRPYEIALLRGTEKKAYMCGCEQMGYDDQVIGYLTHRQVLSYIEKIKQL